MLAEVQHKPSIKVLKYMRTSVRALNVCMNGDSKEFHNIAMFGYCKVQNAKLLPMPHISRSGALLNTLAMNVNQFDESC